MAEFSTPFVACGHGAEDDERHPNHNIVKAIVAEAKLPPTPTDLQYDWF